MEPTKDLRQKYIVIGIHGLGGRAAWLKRLEEEFERYNASSSDYEFSFYAQDLAGFGANGGGHINSFHDWLRAVQDQYENLRKTNPQAKFAIFGHSLGGLIATNLYEIHEGDTLILSVPGYKGAQSTFNPWFMISTIVTFFLKSSSLIELPSSKVTRHGMINGKLYNGDPTESDPLKTKKVSANLLWQILQLGKHSERNLARLRQNPVLLVQVANDPVVDNETQDEMFKLIPSHKKEKLVIDSDLHDWVLYDLVGEGVTRIINSLKTLN